MVQRYKTVNVRHDVAGRARALADAHGLPLATYLNQLVDDTYRAEFGDRLTKVTATGFGILVAPQHGEEGRTLAFPKEYAAPIAQALTALACYDKRERLIGELDPKCAVTIARRGAAKISVQLDSNCTLTISRRGLHIVIEGVDQAKSEVRQTMSRHEAQQLSAELQRFILSESAATLLAVE